MLRKADSVLSAGRWRQANPVGTLYNDDKTLGTTPGQKKKKKKIYISPSNFESSESAQYSSRSKNLLKLNM